LNLIACTVTEQGLISHADLDSGVYPTAINVSDEELTLLNLSRHDVYGDRNYASSEANEKSAT
jgi:Rhodopirellula transposase DDE domain